MASNHISPSKNETRKNNSFMFHKMNKTKKKRIIKKEKKETKNNINGPDFFDKIFNLDKNSDNLQKENELIKIIPINSRNTDDKQHIPPQFKILDMLLNSNQNKNDSIFDEEFSEDSDSDSESTANNDNFKEIECKISNLDDLIKIALEYNDKENLSFNNKKLYNLVSPMEDLKSIIGMHDVKKQIINQIIYSLQNLDKEKQMMHTIITGPPGVGKTMLGYILGKMYFKMGVIKNKKGKKFINPLTGEKEDFKFNIVRRSDLIGEYVGHTAMKTQKVINESLGGILFIDEAYSLGNEEKKDTYSKECIDTLNQNLSENKDKLLVIIAGYKDSLDKCFFSYNPGLKRRFSFRYNINDYTYEELSNIFRKKINDISWKLEENINESDFLNFFKNNHENFKNYGGDMEFLLLCTKINHSLRIFGKHPKHRKKITLDDIIKGYEMFKISRDTDNNESVKYLSMYT